MAPGGPVQARVLVVRVVVVAQLHAADRVHHVGYRAHADLDEVIDGQARQLLHGLNQQLRAAVRVGGVDLVPAHAGNLRVGVTGDRQGDGLAVRRDVDQHDRVGALGAFKAVLHRTVRARVRTRQQVRGAGCVCAARQGAHATDVRVGVPHEEATPCEDENQQERQGLEDQVTTALAARPRGRRGSGGLRRARRWCARRAPVDSDLMSARARTGRKAGRCGGGLT